MNNDVSLNDIFNNVNNWLEFSERKNAYIFSFFSLMVVFTPFINKFASIDCLLKISIGIFYVLYILTMIFTLISFFPITKMSKFLIENGKDKKLKDSDNLLFWGDIYKYSRIDYQEKLKNWYKIKIDDSKLQNDLIDQIIINSNITRNKFECFKCSIILTVIALIQFTVFIGINIIF